MKIHYTATRNGKHLNGIRKLAGKKTLDCTAKYLAQKHAEKRLGDGAKIVHLTVLQ